MIKLHLTKQILALFAALFTLIAGLFAAPVEDTEENYRSTVAGIECYENTIETAVEQTALYNLIEEHFNAALPEGKTEKKAIVIGYDGGRADALRYNDKSGAIYALTSSGGKAYISYCGGVNYPAVNTQDTSTAPGWCSILTGTWADVHGITGNSISKANDAPKTLLTSLVEKGTIDSSAFYVSWDGHFVEDDSTYINELNYINDNKLNVTFKDGMSDLSTFGNVIADLAKKDCSDFIFSIIETPDATGHSSGFSTEKATYRYGFTMCDSTANMIVNAVTSRPTYETEDWLIVLTSDHGGVETGHGGPTIQERMTFIVTNKDVEF